MGVGAHFFRIFLVTYYEAGCYIVERAALEALLEPELAEMGFECVKIEMAGSGRNPIVRVYIDREGGVTISDCTLVSRALSLLLDEADPFPGRYLLEVSSPGNDRPLAKPEHFARFTGKSARIQCRSSEGEKKTYTGTIQSCINDVLILSTDEGEQSIELSNILKAHLTGIEYKIDKKKKDMKRRKRGKA